MGRNVTLIRKNKNGIHTWELVLDNKKTEPSMIFFSEYLNKQELAYQTRESYCKHVAQFIDYMQEASKYYNQIGIEYLNGILLTDTVHSYVTVLKGGIYSENEMIKTVSKNLELTPIINKSAQKHIAAINLYLKLSESLQARLYELKDISTTELPYISQLELWPHLSSRKKIPQKEKISMTKKSMMAGVICGGPKLMISNILSSKKGNSPKKYKEPFPFIEIPNLLESGFKNNRDRSLFSLLGACGGRISEVISICFDDIDIENRKVYLKNPKSRKPEYYNGYFTTEQLNELPWKKRETEETLLIEPFATMFWEYFELYLDREFIPTDKHPFIFQIIKGVNEGLPLIKGDPNEYKNTMKALRKTMYKACENIKINRYGPHSLRHFYGDWCINYFPRLDGSFGLDQTTVQDLMGHSKLDSTRIYAKKETEKLRIEQKAYYAKLNQMSLKTHTEIKLEILEEEIERTRQAIDKEKQCKLNNKNNKK